MTLDFWGLGLQAVNVLILVWLLSRVFWRPVVAAIAKRQDTAKAMIEAAKARQTQADAALAEVTNARTGIAEEREAALVAARAEAESASKATLAEARGKADAILAAAQTAAKKEAETARKANAKQASDLSLDIAARLLERLNGPVVQSAFLSELVDAIRTMPAADRAALLEETDNLKIVMATDTNREEIASAVQTALGGTPKISFSIDPDLIGGLELHSPHFVLRNSWQADLQQVQKAMQDAA